MNRRRLSADELLALPTVIDIETAASALGLGRTVAYRLAKQDQFPVPVLRSGRNYRVPTAGVLALLGVKPSQRTVRSTALQRRLDELQERTRALRGRLVTTDAKL